VSEYLVVRLAADAPGATWIALDSGGHRLTQTAHGPLSEAAVAAENRRVILLIPGIDVLCTQTSLPVKSPARLQQMLPYSLEEVVAEDVEKLHFAAGSRDAAGQMSVAIVTRERLEGWLEQCAQAGIAPDAVYSEADGVPDTPGSVTLIAEGDRTYGRGMDQIPFVLDELTIGEVLEVLQGSADDDSPIRHVVMYADQAGHARCEGELPALRVQTSSIDLQLLAEGTLPRLGSTLINQPGSNLLQGRYGPKSNWGALLKPWQLAAGLLLGLAVLTMAAEGVRLLSLSRQDQALSVLLGDGCQRNFQSARLATCEAEIQRRLAATGVATSSSSQRGFLLTLANVAEARDAESRIEALSFRNGVMDLRVLAPSVPALDEFARTMGAGGEFQVNIQSANPADSGVEGRLQVVGVP